MRRAAVLARAPRWGGIAVAVMLAGIACGARAAEVAAVAASAAVGASAPVQAVDDAPRRAQIAVQLSALKAELAERELACAQQFAVVGCISDARADQHAELTRLNAEDLNHDAAQRAGDAARRQQSLIEKAAAFALRIEASEATDAAALSMEVADPTERAPLVTGDGAAPLRVSKNGLGLSRSALEAQRRAEFEARKRSADAHRLAVLQRNLLRAAAGKQMAPLPAPAATRASEVALQR